MDAAQLKAHAIERVDDVPDEVATTARDEAADWIEAEVVEAGRWPMDLQDMGEESGWSRQHIKNTLDHYFRPIADSGVASSGRTSGGSAGEDGLPTRSIPLPDGKLEIDIPEAVDTESYLQGYVAGFIAGRSD
jgi:hypothetical protein